MSPHSTTLTADPAAACKAAESWVGKFIRDAYERQLGVVIGCELDDVSEEWVLLAKFPGENDPRRIFLAAREDKRDLNYISPGNVKARYRPPTEDDIKRLRAMSRRRAG
jgi:hypothetical protein